MSYPTKYTRQNDYVSYQNANPNRPLPATSIHADLNQVARSSEETIDFLKKSIRADGAIMNGAVGFDQLSLNVQAITGDPDAIDQVIAGTAANATAAATSATAAANNATSSATSATNAAAGASAAATSATNAASSATTAAASAMNATASAAAAATSASAAAAAALGANSIIVSSTALAAATVLPSIKSGICLGYSASGDCAPFAIKRVTAQPEFGGYRSADRFLPDGTTDNTNGGWWIYVSGSAGVDACAFGVKADWNGDDATATPNAVPLQNAVNFTALQFGGNGVDVGGGAGGILLLPRGAIMIEAPVIVHDGVCLLGKGIMGTVFKIAQAFSTNANRFRLGTPGDVASVCAVQSRGSAGDLLINGTNASGGVAKFPRKKSLKIYSAGNDSGRTFTVYYIDAFGAAQSIAVTGANAGSVEVPVAGGIRIVTRVAVNGATAGNVTVGNVPDAAFGCRLEKLQIWSDLLNVLSGVAMVYTDNAQHDGGLYEVKIFGGNAHCARFETGVGGASRFTFEKVETFNHGAGGGAAASVNSQIKLGYGGLLSPIRDIVMGCPGNAYSGPSAVGLEITGGFIAADGIHPDAGIPTGIRINSVDVNQGMVILRNVEGASNIDRLIWIDSAVDNNTVLLEGIYPNGAVVTVKDDPGAANVTGNILAQQVF